MNTRKKHRQVARHGSSAIEVVLTLVVCGGMAIAMYVIAQQSFGNLYQVVSVMAGHPLL